MQRIVLRPLEPTYQVVIERVTSLESFASCGYSFKYGSGYSPTEPSKIIEGQKTFLLGDKLHGLIQTLGLDTDKGVYVYDLICEQIRGIYDEKMANVYIAMLQDAMAQMEDYKTNRIFDIFTNEFKLYIEVEVGNILLILTGSIDSISKNKDGTYDILDYKTSKDEYKIEDVTDKLQKDLYPWIISKTIGWDKFRSFVYAVWTKHIRGTRHQLCPIYNANIVTERLGWPNEREHFVAIQPADTDKFVEDLIIKYCESITKGIWEARNEYEYTVGDEVLVAANKKCLWCDLKKSGKCPAYQINTHLDLGDIF